MVTDATFLFRFSFRAFLTWSIAMDVPAAVRAPRKKPFVIIFTIGRFFMISDEQTPVWNATQTSRTDSAESNWIEGESNWIQRAILLEESGVYCGVRIAHLAR